MCRRLIPPTNLSEILNDQKMFFFKKYDLEMSFLDEIVVVYQIILNVVELYEFKNKE